MKKFIFLFSVAVVLTAILTFPWVFRFSSLTFGGGHPSVVIYRIWWDKYAEEHKLNKELNPLLSAPGGAVFTTSADAPFIFNAVELLNRLIGNEVVAYNILLFLSFPFTFLVVFYLIYYLVKNNFIASFLAVLFTISPYRISHLSQFTLAATYFFPLAILFLIKSFRENGFKNKLMFSLLYVLTFTSDLYYGYFLSIFSSMFLVLFTSISLFKGDRRLSVLGNGLKVLVAFLVGVVLVVAAYRPLVSEYLSGKSDLSLKTSTNDLIMDTARPWDYVIPSVNNPLIGRYSEKIYAFVRNINSNYWFSLPTSRESDIFLGFVPLSLFLISFVVAMKKRSNVLVPVLVPIIVFMFAASLPPDIYLGKNSEVHKVLLSYRLHEKLPMFRSYVRLAEFILLSVLIIAAFGLKAVFQKFSGKKLFVICAGLIIFSGLEYMTLPSRLLSDVSQVPEAYKYIASLPGDFIIAEKPVEYYYGNCSICLNYQRYHQKKLYGPKTTYYFDYFLVKEDIAPYAYGGAKGFLKPDVLEKMKQSGVKYLIFPSNLGNLINDPSSLGTRSKDLLKEIKYYRDYSIFEVI